ncbi:MAG: hypothetical protein QOJ01_2241 [Solirubrobacterales bacterium]|jgi:hypothetical protein|nr:hypothetical protein [Solirubrobacterales bacterium]
MADQSQIPEPSELVYVPSPSWAPAFTAAALMMLTIGAFKGLVYVLIGAVLLGRAILYWVRDADRQADSLPRRQQVSTAVIPATTLKREN